MRLTPAKKKQFELQHPKNKVIKKTDLAKVQNTWRGWVRAVNNVRNAAEEIVLKELIYR